MHSPLGAHHQHRLLWHQALRVCLLCEQPREADRLGPFDALLLHADHAPQLPRIHHPVCRTRVERAVERTPVERCHWRRVPSERAELRVRKRAKDVDLVQARHGVELPAVGVAHYSVRAAREREMMRDQQLAQRDVVRDDGVSERNKHAQPVRVHRQVERCLIEPVHQLALSPPKVPHAHKPVGAERADDRLGHRARKADDAAR
eukprot:1415037-Pleurochrysis_carterae.AAC.2